MGLMFARRRADAAKQIKANKAKAHAENHKNAKAAHQAKLDAAAAFDQNKAAPGVNKPAAK